MRKQEEKKILANATQNKYKYGFVSDLPADTISKGLNKNVIKTISEKKNEPEWMLKKRLQAFDVLQTLKQPDWAKLNFKKVVYRFHSFSYFFILFVLIKI